MILVITGNGKGKTTSALGTALRACGWEKRVGIVFFDKGGSHYGEQNIFDFLQQKIDVFRFGLERFNPESKNFRFENIDDDKKEASRALKKVHTLYEKKFETRNSKLEIQEEGYFLIICDEIINCMNLGLIDELVVRDLINECPKNTHLILTGRNAPDWLIEKADLVSDIAEVKHYFKDGQDAIEGLDY